MTAPLHFPEPAATEPPFVTRALLRARRRVRWLRHLWSETSSESERWLAISHSEVDRLLDGPEELAAQEAGFFADDPVCRSLAGAIRAADDAAAADRRWRHLRECLGLDAPDEDLLSLAVALAIHPQLGRLYGYLQDETEAALPSGWLAGTLFGWPAGTRLRPDTPLVTWALAQPVGPASVDQDTGPQTPWVADPSIVRWLTSPTAPDEDAAPPPAGLCLYPDVLAAMERFVRAFPAGTALEIELTGRAGTGKQTLAAQLCARLGIGLIVAEPAPAADNAETGPVLDRAVRVARTARLTGAAVYWHGGETLGPETEARLHGLAPVALFAVAAPRAATPTTVPHRTFQLPALSRATRVQLWRDLACTDPPAELAEWSLTPAEIAGAAATIPAGEDAVRETCRRFLYLGPGELFSPMPLPFTWDDIVLGAPVRRHLAEFEDQARLRAPVYDGWGFGRLVPLGRGVTALFAGPAGTGKTMAAQVLARSLGLQLYRVDLAGVVNKYIGETEKRLKGVFDACERADVLVLFDEADALFGRRTQVKDAHDRFANIQIDYLLQRMEQFDGIAVLATNRRGDLDDAFVRRLRFIVDFLPPGPEERRRMWQLALPDRSPAGEPLLAGDLDWDGLATALELSGAAIKSAALAAAFLARAEGSLIRMEHVAHAARREMTKQHLEARHVDWGE